MARLEILDDELSPRVDFETDPIPTIAAIPSEVPSASNDPFSIRISGIIDVPPRPALWPMPMQTPFATLK
jgi:hypothetical protein